MSALEQAHRSMLEEMHAHDRAGEQGEYAWLYHLVDVVDYGKRLHEVTSTHYRKEKSQLLVNAALNVRHQAMLADVETGVSGPTPLEEELGDVHGIALRVERELTTVMWALTRGEPMDDRDAAVLSDTAALLTRLADRMVASAVRYDD